MQQDPFGRTQQMMCDAGSWARVAEVGITLASVPPTQLLQELARRFSLLLGSQNPGPVMALFLALQLRGVPPVLRDVFPTTRQMWKGAETRQTLLAADLLWLCSRGVMRHKKAHSAMVALRKQNYAAALSAVNRLGYWLEDLEKNRVFGLRREMQQMLIPYSNELVILPYLLAKPERRIEPACIRQHLALGGDEATALPNGGQARQFDLALVYRSLYAANCFGIGKGFAEAARYYNALAPTASKQATRFYMRTLSERLQRDLPKDLTTPARLTKPKRGAMVQM